MNSMTKYLMNNLRYHGGTSNIGQGISDTYDPTDATIYGSTYNCTYRYHISIRTLTLTSTTISQSILHQSTV
jgi:hypothetical protein